MSRMKVIHSGKTLYDLHLEVGQEYYIGRKESCHIRIEGDHRVSREHAKIFHDGQTWKVEITTKYGYLEYNGQQLNELTMAHSDNFEIVGYKFEFLETEMNQNSVAIADVGSDQPGDNQLNDNLPAELMNDENTIIGALQVVPVLRIYKNNELNQILRLEGKTQWIAGRESSCDIYLPDSRISRRQFELNLVGPSAQIIDLGSSNGTQVNDKLISNSEFTLLRSGDRIQVVEFQMKFELQDVQYDSRLALNSEQAGFSSETQESTDEQLDNDERLIEDQQNQQQHFLPPPQQSTGTNDIKPKSQLEKMRPILIAVALLALVFVFLNDDEQGKEKPKKVESLGIKKPEDPKAALFSKLKPEEQEKVKTLYRQAKNSYMQGKYDQALLTINKIFELIEDYEDIKQLQVLCREALALQEERQRQEDLERAKKEAEEKIQAQVKICEKLLTPQVELAKIEECLVSVLQFNPEHPLFNELRTKAQAIIEKRLAELARKKAYENDVAKLKKLYSEAKSVHQSGQLLNAIPLYNKVIQSPLPDPGGLKTASKNNIAEIRSVIAEKLKKYFSQADKLAEEQKLKQAILVLRDSLKIDPGNKETQERIDNYVFELKKQMMVFYQEGILEESYGNVDGSEGKSGAKAKWKKIIETDVPDGEYYKKAYIKLKKYGAL